MSVHLFSPQNPKICFEQDSYKIMGCHIFLGSVIDREDITDTYDWQLCRDI